MHIYAHLYDMQPPFYAKPILVLHCKMLFIILYYLMKNKGNIKNIDKFFI